MIKYILNRLFWMIPVVLGVAILIFSVMFFVPGDPATIMLGPSATPEEIEVVRQHLGLDQSFPIQLFNYLKDVVRGDFGESFQYRTPVISELMARFPYTLALSISSMVIALIIGILLGVVAAVHQDSLTDRASMVISLIGVSMPSFWLALLMVLVFTVKLGWLPAFGVGGIEFFIMPAVANSFGGIASQARQSRSSVLEVIRADYATTARSKGVSENQILWGHVLPNALIPIITSAGSNFGRMLGGTLIIETVFSMPGIGSYMIQAINNRDYPAVRGSVVFTAVLFSIVMLIVDLCYAYIDPRIKARYMGSKRRKTHA
jgi:peptide/nickel transport system permease protein